MSEKLVELLKNNLRDIPDFPIEGILFHDIVPLLNNPEAFTALIKGMAEEYRGKVDVVAGIESRGFILAAPLAIELGIGMVPIRKAGKLPGEVIGVDYDLEYGSARLELSAGMIKENQRVLLVDDVLATGGTVWAANELIEKSGAKVETVLVIMELLSLNGRDKIQGLNVKSYLQYDC
ncbi:adenine phosphoribosyltransferase [Actinomyces sp. zg-332]|uniref:adenine phosphoribosyltransferase n=1 Tax=Actinomyces sp. zg-332 TaxID=2708340 RepID=UPI00141DC9F2|nr:adenine phosphoribosyltransferase [Actinomyces sp. zg-332]QPK93661.1 adenine phosphoribosyltransferase [Actinomyces sp. zg-332]